VFSFVSVVCETEYWPRTFSPPCRRRRHCRYSFSFSTTESCWILLSGLVLSFEPNIYRFRSHLVVFFFPIFGQPLARSAPKTTLLQLRFWFCNKRLALLIFLFAFCKCVHIVCIKLNFFLPL